MAWSPPCLSHTFSLYLLIETSQSKFNLFVDKVFLSCDFKGFPLLNVSSILPPEVSFQNSSCKRQYFSIPHWKYINFRFTKKSEKFRRSWKIQEILTVAIPNPGHPSPSVLGGISLVQRLKEGKALNKMKLIEINIVWTICHLF